MLRALKESGHKHKMAWITCCWTIDEQRAMSDPEQKDKWKKRLAKRLHLVTHECRKDRDKTTSNRIINIFCGDSTEKFLCFQEGEKVMRIPVAHGDVCLFDREVGAQTDWVKGGNKTLTICITSNPDPEFEFDGIDEERLANLVELLKKGDNEDAMPPYKAPATAWSDLQV